MDRLVQSPKFWRSRLRDDRQSDADPFRAFQTIDNRAWRHRHDDAKGRWSTFFYVHRDGFKAFKSIFLDKISGASPTREDLSAAHRVISQHRISSSPMMHLLAHGHLTIERICQLSLQQRLTFSNHVVLGLIANGMLSIEEATHLTSYQCQALIEGQWHQKMMQQEDLQPLLRQPHDHITAIMPGSCNWIEQIVNRPNLSESSKSQWIERLSCQRLSQWIGKGLEPDDCLRADGRNIKREHEIWFLHDSKRTTEDLCSLTDLCSVQDATRGREDLSDEMFFEIEMGGRAGYGSLIR